jgi:hypothetical protein
MPWLARDSEDTACDCRVAKAYEFATFSFMSAFMRSINWRTGATPGPAHDVPQITERWSSVPTGPSRAMA